MANSAKVLFRGAATTTLTTDLYTVPNTSTSTVVTSIAVCNTNAANQTFDIQLDGVNIFKTATIAALTTAIIDMKQVLPANATPKKIKGGASSTDVIFHISGMEIA